jgi:hypothetical protein
MHTHYAFFMQRIKEGKTPRIVAAQAIGKPFWRVYDLDQFCSGNQFQAACVESRLTEKDAKRIAALATKNPIRFANNHL